MNISLTREEYLQMIIELISLGMGDTSIYEKNDFPEWAFILERMEGKGMRGDISIVKGGSDRVKVVARNIHQRMKDDKEIRITTMA